MRQQVTYIGKPFYVGAYDKEIFAGHLFDVTVHPLTGSYCDCPLSPPIHVRSVRYPQIELRLHDGEYLTRY